jgi:zinc-finger of transposase IS204/IS1001/IS1096/IS1165/Dyp-type peroxidase, C-terminal
MSLDQLEVHAETITIEAHVEASQAACPLCQTVAQRVHSHYTRTLHDVPCGTKALRLVVQVRRFFCDNQDCPRKIFAERLPTLTEVAARMTTRFQHGLAEIGFAMGGRAGAQLGVDGYTMPATQHDLWVWVALFPDGSPGAGGSVVLIQKWMHDAVAFEALAVGEQEKIIGRTRAEYARGLRRTHYVTKTGSRPIW